MTLEKCLRFLVTNDSLFSITMLAIKISEIPQEVTETVLKAALELEIKFGEFTCAWSENKTWMVQTDPAPELNYLDEVYKIGVSSALADYLIEIAGNT